MNTTETPPPGSLPRRVRRRRKLGICDADWKAITSAWRGHATRRADLIRKEYADGALGPEDENELNELQRLTSLRTSIVAPKDRSVLDVSMRKLKRMGLWDEPPNDPSSATRPKKGSL